MKRLTHMQIHKQDTSIHFHAYSRLRHIHLDVISQCLLGDIQMCTIVGGEVQKKALVYKGYRQHM